MYRVTGTVLISTLGLNFVAYAAPPSDARQLVVHFADLDLTRVEGAVAIYHRLDAAAEVVCGPREDRDIARAAAFRKCVQDAIATAVVSVNQPTLTAYYKARRGTHNATVQVARK